MNYIIVAWNIPEDAAILTDTDGNNLVFTNEKNADEYARENCAWNWTVIRLT